MTTDKTPHDLCQCAAIWPVGDVDEDEEIETRDVVDWNTYTVHVRPPRECFWCEYPEDD